jgi:hypothetical protein
MYISFGMCRVGCARSEHYPGLGRRNPSRPGVTSIPSIYLHRCEHGMERASLRPVTSRAEIGFKFVSLEMKIDGGRFGRQIRYAARPSSYGEILIRIVGHSGNHFGSCRMRHSRQFHNDTTTGRPYLDHPELSESVHTGWWDCAVYSDRFLQRCQH